MEYISSSSCNNKSGNEKPPVKHIEKLNLGPVKTKKPSVGRTVAGLIISDEIENVKKHILLDVLVPSIKKAISEAFSSGINMLLYGEDVPDSKKRNPSRINYQSCYSKPVDRRDEVGAFRTEYSYDEIILDTRQKAVEVLTCMDELICTYGTVSIADMYEMMDLSIGTHTDQKYGWTDLRNASAVRVRDGYMLKLPRAIPI